MTELLLLLIVSYIVQLALVCIVFIDDASYDFKKNKNFKSKKELLKWLIPFIYIYFGVRKFIINLKKAWKDLGVK